jgi:hypothetical protein
MGLSRLEPPPDGAVKVAPPGTLLVAIDLENVHEIRALRGRSENNINTQLGVSILDPVHLRAPHTDLIQSIQFASGNEFYTRKASNKFLFGKTVVCKSSELADRLASILPHDRPFLLVAQNSIPDRASMRNLGFDIDSCPQFAGIVDTYPMTGDVFHTGRSFGSLRKILTELGVEWDPRDLHTAGNDAHYTLRAALMLARRGYLETYPNTSMEDAVVLETARTLALAKVPERRPSAKSSTKRMMERMEAREAVQQARVRLRAEQDRLEMETEDYGTELLCLSW